MVTGGGSGRCSLRRHVQAGSSALKCFLLEAVETMADPSRETELLRDSSATACCRARGWRIRSGSPGRRCGSATARVEDGVAVAARPGADRSTGGPECWRFRRTRRRSRAAAWYCRQPNTGRPSPKPCPAAQDAVRGAAQQARPRGCSRSSARPDPARPERRERPPCAGALRSAV